MDESLVPGHGPVHPGFSRLCRFQRIGLLLCHRDTCTQTTCLGSLDGVLSANANLQPSEYRHSALNDHSHHLTLLNLIIQNKTANAVVADRSIVVGTRTGGMDADC